MLRISFTCLRCYDKSLCIALNVDVITSRQVAMEVVAIQVCYSTQLPRKYLKISVLINDHVLGYFVRP